MINRGIYIIRCLINDKVYVGSALRYAARCRTHVFQLTNNKHHSILLQRSWNKYGATNFEFKLIEPVKDKNLLIEREQYWMDKYQSYKRRSGYNIMKYAGSCLGKKVSMETRLRLSESHLNHRQSEESKNKISIGLRKHYLLNGSRKGYKHSNDAKIKIGLASKKRDSAGKVHIAKQRPVVQINKKGEIICHWKSAKDVERTTKLQIGPVCRGERKTAGGFIWKYKDEALCA